MASSKLTPMRHQTKTQALSDYLIENVHELAPKGKFLPMQQLSERLNVSVMTLHRAMSDLEAQNLIYRRQGSGTYVSPRLNQRTVGLVYDRDIFQPGASPFCGLLVEESRRRAASSEEKFSFYLAIPSHDGLPVHDDLVDAIHTRRLQGILFVGEQNPEAISWLLQQKIPTVALAYTPIAPWRVKIDHPAVVRMGVENLVSQGCRRIGLWIPAGVGIGPASGQKSFPELDAFRQALKKHGLTYKPEYVWNVESLTDTVETQPRETNQEQGFRAAFEVFGNAAGATKAKREEMPDGLVILDDMMTRGAVVALGKVGQHVGKDLRIATHTNHGSTALSGYEADLTIIEVDPAEIVQAMFDMLETLMEGKTPASATVSIEPKLKSVNGQ
ncbi:MAG: LacI family DNA-binding transcriptional regulator [Abitibacteriaceae bacterium]|nr:LacI family DNA-binding transcriptional regulator [Abditibacteriaceae bacterium]